MENERCSWNTRDWRFGGGTGRIEKKGGREDGRKKCRREKKMNGNIRQGKIREVKGREGKRGNK